MHNYKNNISILHVIDKSNNSPLNYSDINVLNTLSEALHVFKKKSYDYLLVEMSIEDEKVIEFIEDILQFSSKTTIIVVSNSQSFTFVSKLLNLGIYKFISSYDNKSIDDILHPIFKEKNSSTVIDDYRKELEQKNRELSLRNELLEKTISILDAKVARFGGIESTLEDVEHISQKDILELGELEIDIEGVLSLLSINNSFDAKTQALLQELFSEYAAILNKYNSYTSISENLTLLHQSFSFYNSDVDVLDITELLESFVYVLKNWSLSFALNDFKNTQSYHASIINDITTIVAILKGTDEEFESDIEFF